MEYRKNELVKTINTALSNRDTSLLFSALEHMICHEDNSKRITDSLRTTSSNLWKKILRKELTWKEVGVILKESNLELHMEVEK